MPNPQLKGLPEVILNCANSYEISNDQITDSVFITNKLNFLKSLCIYREGMSDVYCISEKIMKDESGNILKVPIEDYEFPNNSIRAKLFKRNQAIFRDAICSVFSKYSLLDQIFSAYIFRCTLAEQFSHSLRRCKAHTINFSFKTSFYNYSTLLKWKSIHDS